jgi:hypothetical protein
MNKIASSLLLAGVFAAGSLSAADWGSEPVAMGYFKLPLDGQHRTERLASYGFALQHGTYEENGSLNLFSSDRPAFFDMKFSRGQVEGISFNGINALERHAVVYADGSTGVASSLNPHAIAAGVLIGGITLYAVTQDDDDDGGNGGDGDGDGGGNGNNNQNNNQNQQGQD